MCCKVINLKSQTVFCHADQHATKSLNIETKILYIKYKRMFKLQSQTGSDNRYIKMQRVAYDSISLYCGLNHANDNPLISMIGWPNYDDDTKVQCQIVNKGTFACLN